MPLSLALAACAAAVSPGCSERGLVRGDYDEVDFSDALTLRVHDFELSEKADLAALRREEIPYTLEKDRLGRTIIRIYTTGKHAAYLARHGLKVMGSIPEEQLQDVGVIRSPLGVIPPSPLKGYSSVYLLDWVVIEAELIGMYFPNAIYPYILATTVENRHVVGVQFGPLRASPFLAPTVYILGTYHAREWIAEGVALAMARRLRDAVLAQSGDLYNGLQNAAAVVVPVVNPDGYQYSRDTDRMWRTNRFPSCGVDLNRNHTTAWF